MRILLVGALRAETAPLIRWLEQPRRLGPRLLSGRRGEHELGLLTCGVGPDRARDRTAAALARWPAEVVISLGTCGALADGLAVGAVRTADRLAREGASELPIQPLAGLPRASVLTVDAPVLQPERRAALASGGWDLCEMEAAAVAAAAAAVGARAHALKVVSDRAGADRPGARLRRRDLLRFKALAARLVAGRLAPALAGALGPSPASSR